MKSVSFVANDPHIGLVIAADGRVTAVEPRIRHHQLPPGACAYCDRERGDRNEFHPPHDASDRCESGKHAHCSCDVCW